MYSTFMFSVFKYLTAQILHSMAFGILCVVLLGSISSPIVYAQTPPATTPAATPSTSNPSGTASSVSSPGLGKVNITDAEGSQSGFKECTFNFKDATGGDNILKKCVQSVVRFVLVVGLFTLVFRIAYAAIMNINGGTANSSKLIKDAITDIFIGLLLVGAPGLIIYTINPAALNLGFLNLGKISVSQSSGVSSVNGGGGGGSGTTTDLGGGKVSFGSVSSSTTPDEYKILYGACSKDPNTADCKTAITQAVTLKDKYDTQCKGLSGAVPQEVATFCAAAGGNIGPFLNELYNLKDKVTGGITPPAKPPITDLSNCLQEKSNCVLAKDYQLVDSTGDTYNPRPGSYYLSFEPSGGGKPGDRFTIHFEGSGCGQNPIVKEFEIMHSSSQSTKSKIATGSALGSANCVAIKI
jgi:hypothetical protein